MKEGVVSCGGGGVTGLNLPTPFLTHTHTHTEALKPALAGIKTFRMINYLPIETACLCVCVCVGQQSKEPQDRVVCAERRKYTERKRGKERERTSEQ